MTDLDSRRRLLGIGARLAIGLPAVLAALGGAAPARADDDGRRRRGSSSEGRSRDEHEEREENEENEEEEVEERVTFAADLTSTSQVGGASDFDINAAGEPCRGRLQVRSSGGSSNAVFVRLRDAAPGVTYTVSFDPFKSKTRETIGSFQTDQFGDFSGRVGMLAVTPSTSANQGRGTRVGIFVLSRGSADEFVTAA